jgi:ESS family glutamate:Na+ symporter
VSSLAIHLDLLQTTGIAAIVVFLGLAIKKRVKFFRTYCIPAPVISGLLVSFLLMFLKLGGIVDIEWTLTLKEFFMDIFFTCVGFGASSKLLKSGGKICAGITFTVVALITLQDIVGVGLAIPLGLHPLHGLGIGSVAMSGGVGTAGAFGPIFEKYGAEGATVISVAAATFGMILGSLVGGPVAKALIKRHNLTPDPKEVAVTNDNKIVPLNTPSMLRSACTIIIIAAAGTGISALMKLIPMIKMPYFVGCLFAGVIARNIMEPMKIPFNTDEFDTISSVSLDLFLALTLMSLDLTKLVDAAGPMLIILAAEALLMGLWAYFVTYRVCGKNYNGAVMAAGHCGMGLGAGPNAVANEQSVIAEYGPANLAWILFPALSVVVDDIWNPILISVVSNFLK